MTITAVFVLFSVTWFLVLFLCLQINIKTQSETGEIVAGTHASAPEGFDLKKRLWVTTLVSIPLCGIIIFTILSDYVTLETFSFFNVFAK
jgi:predicted secreted protein